MFFGVAGTVWSLRNEKSKFFFAKMTLTHATPPLLSSLRDITQEGNQGGLHVFPTF